MEQVKGIEPSSIAWKAIVLPLNYTCKNGAGKGTWTLTPLLARDLKSRASTIPPFQLAIFLNGVPCRVRTYDPFIKSEMLYRWANGTFWLGWLDLNQRMIESKSIALPLGYSPIYGGQWRIRTAETRGNCFTDSCVWPLR